MSYPKGASVRKAHADEARTMIRMTDTYRAETRNTAYLMERACVAAANAESDEAIGWRRLFEQDARTLTRLARERWVTLML